MVTLDKPFMYMTYFHIEEKCEVNFLPLWDSLYTQICHPQKFQDDHINALLLPWNVLKSF